MALRYTGQADTFTVQETGKTYEKGPDGKTAVLTGFPKETALMMSMNSNMHTFEDDGTDIVEKATAPQVTDAKMAAKGQDS